MAFAQCLLEWIVQLLRLEFLSLLEVQLHEFLVDFDDLVNDLCVCGLDVTECCLVALGLEVAVNDFFAVGRRQVQRQALRAKGVTNFGQQDLEIHFLCVNLVDDDHPAEILFLGRFHHASRDHVDAFLGIDDDGGGLCGWQN